MCHLLYFILLYCALSISAVMLDRVIAIAKPILYRNMVRQRSLKKCFYLLVVLKWNWFKWAGDLCSEYCASFLFRWRNRCSVRALLCFLAAFSRSCPTCHYGLVLFKNVFSSLTLTMQNPLTSYILLSHETWTESLLIPIKGLTTQVN